MHGVMILFQMADSMEVNILGIIGPILKCEWLLYDWQVALYSSVSITTHDLKFSLLFYKF